MCQNSDYDWVKRKGKGKLSEDVREKNVAILK